MMAWFSKDELSFVKELPEQIEIECLVCLNILTDPHQVSCCGRNFCKSCIEKVKDGNGSCPLCKEETYQSFEDKNIGRIINGLQVYCTNKAKGCQWKGDLKYLPTHLNKGKREGECQFEEVECQYDECLTRDQRQHLNVHEKEECDQRPYSCEHCHTGGTYFFITFSHMKVCSKYPTKCPNECSSSVMPRDSVPAHLTQCPLEPVDCVFSWAGCNDKPLRKDVHVHTADTKHMTLLAVACGQLKKENEEIKEEMTKENEKIKKLEEENEQIIEKMKKENEKIKEEMKTENVKRNEKEIETTTKNLIFLKEISQQAEIIREESKIIKKGLGRLNEENKETKRRLRFCFHVIKNDRHPFLPVTINGRDVAHFYTEFGGHHMSAAIVRSEKLCFAFHKGKFDELLEFEYPKILLLHSCDAEPMPIPIKSYQKVADSALSRNQDAFAIVYGYYGLGRVNQEGVISVPVSIYHGRSINIFLSSPNEVTFFLE